jgi:hypothetical protein
LEHLKAHGVWPLMFPRAAACGVRSEASVTQCVEQRLRQNAARGVVRAKKEDVERL